MITPKTMPTSNIIQVKYVVLMEIYIHICICMWVYTTIINERSHEFERHNMEEKEEIYKVIIF